MIVNSDADIEDTGEDWRESLPADRDIRSHQCWTICETIDEFSMSIVSLQLQEIQEKKFIFKLYYQTKEAR